MTRLYFTALSVLVLTACVDHNVDHGKGVDHVAQVGSETDGSNLIINCDDNGESCEERNTQSKKATKVSTLSEKTSDLYKYSEERLDKIRAKGSADIVDEVGDGVLFESPQVNYDLAAAYLREGNLISAIKHLEISGGVGLPEARYELGMIYGGEYGDKFKNSSFEYAWFATTDQVYRERSRTRRYRNAEKKARELRESLSVTELKVAKKKVVEIQSNTSDLRRQYMERSGQ